MARTLVPTLVLILSLAIAPTSASAAYTYQLVAENSSYSLTPGSTAVVNVFLQETVTGSDTPRLTGAGNGLLTAGVRINFGPSAPARVLSAGDILPNTAGFTSALFLTTDLPGDGTAGISEAVDFGGTPVAGVVTGAGVSRVFLGGFRLTGVTGGSFTLSIGDYNTSLVDTVTAQGFGIDSPSSNLLGSTVQVVVVPEPQSLALLSLGAAALLSARARRRRPA